MRRLLVAVSLVLATLTTTAGQVHAAATPPTLDGEALTGTENAPVL